jgi:hypothetical protein
MGQDLIVRTANVPAYSDYSKYRRYVRYDFYYSCAYCTVTEAEAEAARFTIDHYEPVSAMPELRAVYTNLMYACDECNSRKGDLFPPPDARRDGYRFFRPDMDRFGEHFAAQDRTVSAKTKTGYYTITALGLNRKSLCRLRELRLRLKLCDQYVTEGIRALRNVKLDQLHPEIRARASRWIKEALDLNERLVGEINEVLRAAARSSIIVDDDEDDDRDVAARRDDLKRVEGLYPGQWRGRWHKKSDRN